MAGNNEDSTPPYASGSSFTAAPTNDGLFSDVEKKQLNSFLDAFGTPDDHTYSNHFTYNEDKTNAYTSGTSSPTPVLLSLPYSKNTSGFGPNRKRGNERGIMAMDTSSNADYKKRRPGDSSSTDPPFVILDETPPPTKPKGSGRGRKPAHELLSDDQKKANHIASEQKRRANIRLGFDQLVGVVPNLTECQRSESLILQKSVDYIRQLVDTKNGLRDRVRELQTALGEVPDEDSSEGEMDYDF